MANVLFVDNPVGTGYSYVDIDAAYTTDVTQIANDLVSLFQAFLKKYPIFEVCAHAPDEWDPMEHCHTIDSCCVTSPYLSFSSVLPLPIHPSPLVHTYPPIHICSMVTSTKHSEQPLFHIL